MKITDSSGTYEFSYDGGHRIHVKKHGQECVTFEQGHKALLSLMHEVEDLRESLQQAEDYADSIAVEDDKMIEVKVYDMARK
jgi:hypothetical protein